MRKLDRREFVERAALGAAGLYALVDSLAAAPARAAVSALKAPSREQHLLRGVKVATRDGVEFLVPPLHHQIVTAKLRVESTASALMKAQARLEQALARLDRTYEPTPRGLGVTVAWGEPYFKRFLPRLGDGRRFPEYLPEDTQTSWLTLQRVPVLLPSPRFASDDGTLLLEQNDLAVLLRSDSLDHVAAAAEAIFGKLDDLFEVRSIRKGFVGGGLPKRMALAAGIRGAELIPDDAQLFLGFTSTQRKALGPGRITNFETLAGMTNQGPKGYFRGGTIMHLSHLFEDLERWWTSFSFDDQVRAMANPRLRLPHRTFTLPQDTGGLQTERDVVDDAASFQAVGHSGSLQHMTRLDRDVVDNYGNLRPKGTSFVQRADFNTLDNPFFWSAAPKADGQGSAPAAGVHFVTFAPTSASFHRSRWAMDGVFSDGTKLDLGARSRGQGFNSVIRATHRQNFLVPPRSHRSFPLAEALRAKRG